MNYQITLGLPSVRSPVGKTYDDWRNYPHNKPERRYQR